MSKKDNKIEPIDDSFNSVAKTIMSPKNAKKVTRIKPLHINKLPKKNTKEVTTPKQGSFDLTINCQKEIHGVGMGVLSDGTPFLTQRGLARLCGIDKNPIGTISSQWNETPEKSRITKIKEILASRGFFIESPHITIIENSQTIYAYPDSVCLAVLEYYAFEAGNNSKKEAEINFRILAGQALQDFIYTQVGYDPNHNLPENWKHFHNRMSLVYDSVPIGYFGIFKEIADIILTLGQNGLHIDSSFVPDISIGKAWGNHWEYNNLTEQFGERIRYQHNYPSDFPQAKSNPQEPWCYPERALGEFRRWLRENYIGDGKFLKYIDGQVKKKALPASFSQLVIQTYNKKLKIYS